KREIQAAVILGDAAAETAADGEILTWSASSKGREGWFKRMESGRSALLLSDRDIIIKEANIRRHDRVLVAAANDGLLLWESLRHTPEGLSAAIVDSEAAKEALLRFAAAIDEEEKPLVMTYPSGGLPLPQEALSAFGSAEFDHIVAREPWRRMSAALISGEETFSAFAEKARDLLTKTGDIVLLQSPPALGERISRLLDEFLLSGFSGIPDGLSALLKKAEDVFFTQKGKEAGRWVWDGELLQNCFIKTGFTVTIAEIEQKEERLLGEKDLLAWFDKEKSSWGKFMSANLGEKKFLEIKNVLSSRIKEGPLTWRWKSLLLKGKL
ncbi:MAG: recombinase RarA, partial [Treponema sp.]|nr:recombinase RarA [Treponema sp.]